jgi:hypothetical protein
MVRLREFRINKNRVLVVGLRELHLYGRCNQEQQIYCCDVEVEGPVDFGENSPGASLVTKA